MCSLKVIIMRNWGSRKKNDCKVSQTVPKDNNKRRNMFKLVRPGLFFIKRAPIFIIILAFLFNCLLPQDYLAWAKKTDTMPSPIGKESSVGPGQLSLLGPSDIEIPPLFGTVKEKFQQDKEPKGLIVHIQDLHTHYQAHKKIAKIIENIVRTHNINVILCEAKSTDKGFAYLRPWTDKDTRVKVADENLKKGILTGWEALDLTSDLDLVLQGIEDKDLYMKDMDSFLRAEVFRPDALKFVDLLKSIVENLKLHMYSAAQKAFDEKMRLYREEKIGIKDYTNHLIALAKRYDIDHEKFHNLGILLETLELEDGIDFKKAEIEREAIIDGLSKRLLDEEMKVLLDMSIKFKANRISQNKFYQYILTLTKKFDVNTLRYPNFRLYTKYIATYHKLDASKLFEEINAIENDLAKSIFVKEDQNKLFQISKNLIILKALVDFKLTPDEFDYYDKTKTSFDMKGWLEFLRLNSEYFKLAQYVPDDASIIEDNLTTLESFYKIAHQRDEAFVRNIDEQFAKRNIQSAILMTGGFHTPGVMRRLKDAGYSYVVISPCIEEEMNYKKYHERLKESYKMLKESTAISPWSVREIPNNILAQIGIYKGINFANPGQRPIFETRGAAAIITAEGEGILSRGLLPLTITEPEQFDRFLELIDRLRKEKGAVSPEEMAEILQTAQIVREPEQAIIKAREARRAALGAVLAFPTGLTTPQIQSRVREMLGVEVPEITEEMARARREALGEVLALPEGLTEEEARAEVRKLVERGPEGRDITPRYTSAEGLEATVVIVREGVVETYPTIFVEGKVRVLEEYSVRLAPGQAAEVKPKAETPARILAPAITPEALEIVAPLVTTENIMRNVQESRREVLEHRGDIIGRLGKRLTRVKIDVDAIAATLEPAERREAFIRYFALLVESLNMWRIEPTSNIYFDFVGTNAELVNEIKSIYYSLPIVTENIRTMQLWDEAEITDEARAAARVVAISYIESGMFFDNPTFYVRERIFERDRLNFIDWNRAILASLRTALGIDQLEEVGIEDLAEVIKKDLPDETTNFAKLKQDLLLLFGVERPEDITADHIWRLYSILPRDAEGREDYVRRIGLYIRPIEAISFEELREMHEMLKEVQLSI